jgi:hypothetical protein
VTALCIAGADALVRIAGLAFTLSWTHTVQKTRWEEDWRVAPDRLVLVEARVQGSGAGMEPPPEAVLRDGFYRWRPGTAVPELLLRQDPGAGAWSLCAADGCATIRDRLGRPADPVRLAPCP